jgi:hypothetical protein
MMFLTCPAYLDQDKAARCGLPAEVRCRFTMHSTGGPLESVMIRCPAGHHFNGPVELLAWDGTDQQDPGTAGPRSRAGRDSLQRGHDGRRREMPPSGLLEFRLDALCIAVVQVLQDHQAPLPRAGGIIHVPRRLIGVSQMLENQGLVIPVT